MNFIAIPLGIIKMLHLVIFLTKKRALHLNSISISILPFTFKSVFEYVVLKHPQVLDTGSLRLYLFLWDFVAADHSGGARDCTSGLECKRSGGHRIFLAIGVSFCVLSPYYTINL